MLESNFTFLQSEYPKLASLGFLAEKNLYDDPSTSLTKLRILSEKTLSYIADFENITEFRYGTRQFDKLKQFEQDLVVPKEIIDIFHEIRKSGNTSSHDGEGTTAEARYSLRQAFHLCQWFYELYENQEIFVEFKIPTPESLNFYNHDLATELEETKAELEAFKLKIKNLQNASEKEKQDRKTRSNSIARKTEETEAETRDRIDRQLRDAGWECDTQTINFKKNKSLPQKNKNIAIAEWKCGNKWADYALFIGNKLVGIVEAKRHIKNVMADLGQAKEYSQLIVETEGVEFPNHYNAENYKIPFVFATNGRKFLEQYKETSGIWFWDARKQYNREKPITEWFLPRDLQEKLAFDETIGNENLQNVSNDFLTDKNGLNLYPYQQEAVDAIEKHIIDHPTINRALLAMATGTGKTRTIIGAAYRLIASGRFKRILFLVDRNMLGNQAIDSFNELKIEGLQTFSQIYDLQGLEVSKPELDTKIHFATVQSMVHRILHSEDEKPSIGAYDCIIVDEAHRGYTLDRDMDDEELIVQDQIDFQSKYRLVLDYFDAYRIGLTATPATHTEEIFGKPIYYYSYRRAVVEGFLIDFEPPYVFQTHLTENGIIWNKGDEVKVYDPECNEIKSTGNTDDEIKVEIQGFNRRVITENFNRTVLQELISNPEYAIHPDDPKKTLIFAATDVHADMIVRILKEEFEEMGEEVDEKAIVKITGSVKDRENLLKRYQNEQYPSIVVTVDLLTTGIDVRSICNLVFLRRVNSRILYDQMMGRATRKCDEIGKEIFRVFDCVGVTEIMGKEEVMKPVSPAVSKTFVDLALELSLIKDDYQKSIKIDRILAKLRRKTRSFDETQLEYFKYLTNDASVDDFINQLKSTEPENIDDFFDKHAEVWEFLDREKNNSNYAMLFSEHEDLLKEATRAYEKNLKPKDYIESFNDLVKNKLNELAAIKIVCNNPASLTRKDLKEIKLILDENGFTDNRLNTAHKELTNQNIAADIIAHIRTAALGSSLISHEVRINRAVDTLLQNHSWNPIQIKWLENFRKQLLQESIIGIEDLNKPPFSNDGGLKRLEKIFKNQTQEILNELNQYLYKEA